MGHYGTWESAVDGFGNVKDTIKQRKQLYPERLPPAKHKLPKRYLSRMKISESKIQKHAVDLKVETTIMSTKNDAIREWLLTKGSSWGLLL